MKNLVEGIDLSQYAFSESERNLQDNLITNSLAPFHEDGSNLTITFLSLNRSGFSIRLLDSIQTYLPDFKGNILIIDNGSEAEELNKLKAFITEIKFPIKLYEANQNLGVAGGRNKASELIETEWFLSLDNDVYFIENPLSVIKECVDKLGVHFLNIPLLNSDGYTIFQIGGNLSLDKYKDSYAINCPPTFKQTLKSEVNIKHPFLSTCLLGTAAVMRTKSFVSQGGFDDNMLIGFEDLDFSIKLYKEGIKVGNLNKFCAVHGHDAPLNLSDLDYEKTRYSKKILRESGEYFHSKHNIYAWTEDVKEWIAARESKLELKSNNLDFSQQTETHHQNKVKHLGKKSQASDNLPQIALIADSENSIPHQHAQQIAEQLSNAYDFQILFINDYPGIEALLLEVKDFDLVHFFQSDVLFNILSKNFQKSFSQKGWDYLDFLGNVVATANITISADESVAPAPQEEEKRNILLSGVSISHITGTQKTENSDSPIPEDETIENQKEWNIFFESVLSVAQNKEAKRQRDILRKNNFELYLAKKELETKLKEVETSLGISENRVSELDNWTVELQKEVSNSHKWSSELQKALQHTENHASNLTKLNADLHANLLESEACEQKERQELEAVRQELEITRQNLENSQAVITNMKASKFWKMRNQALKVKNVLAANKKED